MKLIEGKPLKSTPRGSRRSKYVQREELNFSLVIKEKIQLLHWEFPESNGIEPSVSCLNQLLYVDCL